MITKDSPQLMTIVANIITKGRKVSKELNPAVTFFVFKTWRFYVFHLSEHYILAGPARGIKKYKKRWERETLNHRTGSRAEIEFNRDKAIKALLRVLGLI